MFRNLLASLDDVRKDLRRYLNFGLFYLLSAGILMIPLLSYIMNRVLISAESGVLLNLEFSGILLNREGMLSVLGVLLLVVLMMFILMGSYLIIAQKRIFGKAVTVTEAILTAFRALPRLLGFELSYVLLFLLLLLPLVEIPATPVIRRFMETPPTLLDAIRGVRYGLILYRALIILFALLLLRWIFAFQEMLLERKSLGQSMRISSKLTKGIRAGILIKLLLMNAVILGAFFFLWYQISRIPVYLGIEVNASLRQYFITLSGLMLFLFLMILLPVNLSYLTRLYYDLKRRRGFVVEDSLQTVKWRWLMAKEEELEAFTLSRKSGFLAILAFSLLLSFFFSYRINDSFLYTGRNVLIAAHRGDAVHTPENSLSSIRSAFDHGATLIELDVQMTRDGVLVLHHDRSLIRMAGVPESVSSLTHEELMDLEIGSSFSDEFKGERIPTLEEALELIGDQGEVLLDVKTEENKEVVAKKLLSLLEEKQMKDRAYIQSFDYEFLRMLRAMDGEIRLGQIMYAALGRLELLDVDFYTVQMNMLSRDLVRRAHEADRGIFVWVIKTEDQLKNVLQYDISGVIISDPLMASDILRGTEESVLEEAP